LAWYGKKAKPNTTKAHIHQSKKMYYNTKKTKPGLAAFYNIWPGNGAGLFKYGRRQIRKSEEKKNKWGSIRYKQANNIYSAKIKNRIKGASRPGARKSIAKMDARIEMTFVAYSWVGQKTMY